MTLRTNRRSRFSGIFSFAVLCLGIALLLAIPPAKKKSSLNPGSGAVSPSTNALPATFSNTISNDTSALASRPTSALPAIDVALSPSTDSPESNSLQDSDPYADSPTASPSRPESRSARITRPATERPSPYPSGIGIFSPFMEADRKDLRTLRGRIVGKYGDFRRSYVPGHLHAGTDFRGRYEESVYPIAPGRVILISGSFPNKSIVIRHDLSSGRRLYSLYVHVEDIRIREGDAVDENTLLGRIFTEEELRQADFGTDVHLHLEIRNSFEDLGRASYTSMNRDDLDKYCMDPMGFFSLHLAPE